MERRTIVRLLLVFGIGIPLLVEAITFAGLVGQHLGGTGTATPSATPSPTSTPVDTVGVGDELLPETNQSDRLTTASLTDAGDSWLLTLTVTVTNTGESPYELRLGAVVTSDDTSVSNDVSTGQLAAGETGTVTGQWRLPAGDVPERLEVEAVVAADDAGTVRTVSETVTLTRMPVED